MDETGAAFIKAMEPYGLPAIILSFCVVVFLIMIGLVILPTWKKRTEADIELEHKREERAAKEQQTREELDKQRAALEGRWLAAMESSTKIIGENTETMKSLITSNEASRLSFDSLKNEILESRARNREMQQDIHDIYGIMNRRGENNAR